LAFAIGTIESIVLGQFVQTDPLPRDIIFSQPCPAALESCHFQQFVSGGLRSCASFMTRHSTDESCSLVISLSGVAGVILGNTNERIHICGRWASRASCEVGRSG